jgi:Domain of unknown function (DUF4336)
VATGRPWLQPFGPNIWTADGPLVRDMGLTFKTRMTVVRLTDGSLWVESPVSTPPESLNAVHALGEVGYLVAGTQKHTWRLAAWQPLFPDAQLWAPGKTSLSIAGVRAPVNDVLTDVSYEGWAADVDQLVFRGSPFLREVHFLHRTSGTVILGDVIQANPPLEGKALSNLAFRVLGIGSAKGGVPRDIRLGLFQRSRARESLERLLSWDFDKLILSHGDCITRDAKAYIRSAFRWLDR